MKSIKSLALILAALTGSSQLQLKGADARHHNLEIHWVAASVPVASSWVSVASSADGAKLVAAGYPGYPWNYDAWTGPPTATWAQTKVGVTSEMALLYVSSDSGATWTPTSAPSNYWISVASSADGTILAAVAGDYQRGQPGHQTSHTYGAIYVSYDSGATWTRTASPVVSWEAESSVVSSADGSELVASAYYGGGRVYTSFDYGADWRWQTGLALPAEVISAIVCSSAGDKIFLALANSSSQGGQIYMSQDKGASWIQTSAPSLVWSSLAASCDATKLYAGVGYGAGPAGPIYTSNDGGTTWEPTSAPNLPWWSLASSGDGAMLVAASFDGHIYVSFDAGATWVSTRAPQQTWSCVASSANGRRLVAVSVAGGPQGAGGIYTLHLPFRVPLSPAQTPRATQSQLQN